MSNHQQVCAFIEQEGIVFNMKPLIAGDEISSCFGVSGPAIGTMLERCIAFQLEHPHAGRDEAVAFLTNCAK